MGDDSLAMGQAALASGSWAQARTAFEAALAVHESPHALSGLGGALWWLGEPRSSLTCHEQAYAAFVHVGDEAAAVRSALAIAIASTSDFGNRLASEGWVARAERRLASVDEPALLGWLLVTRGYVTTEVELSVSCGQRALVIAREAGDSDLALCALTGLGRALVSDGRVAEGMAMVDEAMAGVLGGEAQVLDTVAYACCDMLRACELAGDRERAAEWCRVADDFVERYGCPFLFTTCRTHYGGVLVAAGRWDLGERQLVSALATASPAGGPLRSEAAARLAELRVMQGRLEEAAALVDLIDDPAAAVLPAARLALARGEPQLAASWVERGLRSIGIAQPAQARLLDLRVDVMWSMGNLSAAEEAAGRLSAIDQGALSERARGRVAELRDDHDDAVRHYEAALSAYASVEAPYESARLRMALARTLSREHPEAAVVEARRAAISFEEMGASPDRDAARALMRSLGATAPAGPRGADELSRREREVLDLVGLGLSNPEIAERLFISRKTAAHHVGAVLTKLGLRNRAEAAAYASRSRTDV